jgi:hypothetical protein
MKTKMKTKMPMKTGPRKSKLVQSADPCKIAKTRAAKPGWNNLEV